MNDDDILDYIEDSRNLRALGTELEFAYDENDMLILKQYVEPTRLQGITEGLQRVAGTTASIGAGAVGATLGFPTDLASLFVSIGKSVGAEDGKKLETFTNTFETLSKENYGSQFYKGLFDNFIDDLNISNQKKKDFKAGFVGGEFLGVGNVGKEAAKKAPAVAKSIRETSEEVGKAAQKRVAENQGSMTMSSMGVGEMSNMVNKGLSKLAPTEGKVVNLKPKVDRLNFYSKAEEVTNQLKQNKGTGQQYRQQLLKAGVKPDEIEWLGLDDVLNKGKITKQQLQDQINANRIELDEVELSGGDDVLGGLATRFNENKTVMSAEDAFGPEYLQIEADEILEHADDIDDAMKIAKERYDDNPIMKYVDPETGYTITGNGDVGYQIFRSEAESSNFRNAIDFPDTPYSLNEAIIRVDEELMDTGAFGGPMMGGEGTRFGEYTEPGGDNYREFLIKYNNPEVQFDESHFDESNIIAHFRTKDRTTSDGKKVFYIEEIQSDWGQKFRKERGNMPESLPMLSVPAPKAPFITDTDKWTQLTLKRILSKAVDEGYDFVSISSGMVQGARFNNKGLVKFYNEIIPKNAEKIVKKLDKNAIQKDKEITIGVQTSLSSGDTPFSSTRPKKRFSIELTPQLKEKVKKGMAMFSATPLVVGQENE